MANLPRFLQDPGGHYFLFGPEERGSPHGSVWSIPMHWWSISWHPTSSAASLPAPSVFENS